jgi:hypothetical protein
MTLLFSISARYASTFSVSSHLSHVKTGTIGFQAVMGRGGIVSRDSFERFIPIGLIAPKSWHTRMVLRRDIRLGPKRAAPMAAMHKPAARVEFLKDSNPSQSLGTASSPNSEVLVPHEFAWDNPGRGMRIRLVPLARMRRPEETRPFSRWIWPSKTQPGAEVVLPVMDQWRTRRERSICGGLSP